MQNSSDSEPDEKILDITRQLCQRLDIPNYKPTTVHWRASLPSSGLRGSKGRWAAWPHDKIMLARSTVALSSEMKTRLDPDEFGPLVASELIYAKKLKTQVRLGFLASLIATVAIFAAELIFLPQLLPQPITSTSRTGDTTTQPLGSFITLLTGPLIVIFGTMIPTVMYARRVRLQADISTEKVLGANSLLKILNKIASLGDKSLTGRRAARGAYLPSLKKRIANLQRQRRPESSNL